MVAAGLPAALSAGRLDTAGVELAYAVAAVHAAAVVLLVVGPLLALRWPGVVRVHVPVAVSIAAVRVAGADCPLTTWERALRARSGADYDGGFLDHYLFGPLGLVASDPGVQAGTYAVAVLPSVVGYGLLAVRSRRRAALAAA